ncbi:unnamed protein product [Lactuca saligna]|uniref:Uncharacterized protein n=1 Tax=Lactuca saligna TaxID=75948 RepID=A0AA35ZVG0_LACSI|nr:unnamed protein product [Lactuca saligna]
MVVLFYIVSLVVLTAGQMVFGIVGVLSPVDADIYEPGIWVYIDISFCQALKNLSYNRFNHPRTSKAIITDVNCRYCLCDDLRIFDQQN